MFTQVNGKQNWASGMDKYVDCIAKVEGFTGKDSQGCRMARLSVSSETITNFTFRVRDLELVTPSSFYDTLQGDSRIDVGSEVIIHKHRAVCLFLLSFSCFFHCFLFTCFSFFCLFQVKGSANWASEMDNYVGMRATVKRFTGVDSAGCKMASLDIDGKNPKFAFRVRDLTLLA